MAYDFSKKKVSAKDLSKKRKDAVAASRKSSSSSSGKIDTPDVTPANILSDSWQKDVVSLEEAKQQSREAGTYLQTKEEEYREAQGIVTTVDTAKAGISESWNKDTVTLEEAKAQTGQAQAYIEAKTDQSNEAIAQANATQEQAQAAPQPLPSHVDPDSPLGKAAIESGQYYAVRDEGHPSTIDSIRQVTAHPDRTARMAALLGVRAAASGTGEDGTDVRRGPLYVKTVTEGKSIKDQISGLFREGVDGATNEVAEPSSVQFSKGNYATTYGIYQKAETVASQVNNVAGKAIDAAFEVTPIEKVYDFMLPGNIGADTVKEVNKGAAEAVTGMIPLVAGIPLAGEIAIREPEKVGSAVVLGTGLIVGSVKKQAEENPARLAGNIAGGLILGKVAGGSAKGAYKGVKGISESRPTVAGATQKVQVMGMDAEIPKVATSPNIGKTAKDFFKHANEPDVKVIETPDTAQVLTGYTITKEAGAAKVRPRVEIIEAKEIPAGELEAFKAMDPRTSRTLSSKYKKSTIRDGMTTLDEGTREVQLYRATRLEGQKSIVDPGNDVITASIADDWNIDVTMPKTKGTGRAIDSIEQFESRKVTEIIEPEFAEDLIRQTSFEKTMHPRQSVDRINENYEFVRAKIAPEKKARANKPTSGGAVSRTFGDNIQIGERFEGGLKIFDNVKVQGKIHNPNAKAWKMPELAEFKSIRLFEESTEGAMIDRGTIGSRGRQPVAGRKGKFKQDIVPDDAFIKGNFKTQSLTGFTELGGQVTDQVRILGELKYANQMPDKLFTGKLPKTAKNAVSGRKIKRVTKPGTSTKDPAMSPMQEVAPAKKFKSGIDAKQILDIKKGSKRTVNTISKDAQKAFKAIERASQAGIASAAVSRQATKSRAKTSETSVQVPVVAFDIGQIPNIKQPLSPILSPAQTTRQTNRQTVRQNQMQDTRQDLEQALDVPEELRPTGSGRSKWTTRPREKPLILPGMDDSSSRRRKGNHGFKVGGRVRDNKWTNPMSIDFSKSLKPTTRATKKTTKRTKTSKRR